MLGLQDINILIVFLVCILGAGFCVAYGYCNWNKGQELESEEISEELLWEKAEEKCNEIL